MQLPVIRSTVRHQLVVAVVLSLVMLPLVTVRVTADVKEIALRDLAAGSGLIVVVTVTNIEDGPRDFIPVDERFSPVKVATAQVVETWKGAPVREVRFVASPTWICDMTHAEKGERLVMFLEKRKATPIMMVAHDGRGGMPLRDVKVKTYATLPGKVILPEGTPTISETKTVRYDFKPTESGKTDPESETFTYSVLSVELDVLRELVRSSGH